MGEGVGAVELGRLLIEFDTESYLLGSELPIEVRDASNRVVSEGQGSVDEMLPLGTYRVQTTLPDGQRADELVELRGPRSTLRFGSDTDPPSDVDDMLGPDRSLTRYLYTSPGDEPRVPVRLARARGASARELDGGWLFEPQTPLDDAPYAEFTTDTSQIRVSLPINPAGDFPLDACVVVPVAEDHGVRLDVRFVRQRMVAANLDGQLRSGAYVDPRSFLDAAGELLFHKYRDPTAAALGGLTLHRLGRLAERSPWVANLARGFGWLADGRILEVALHAHDEDAETRASWLNKLLEVARMRPMFADGHALLLDLLRRWPDGSDADRRAAAVAELTSRIVGVDWSATALIEYSAAAPVERRTAPSSPG